MGLVWRVSKERLEPTFAQQVEALLMPAPSDWYVTYGFRSLDEQAALYAKYRAGGPKAAPPGLSAHNYGLAVDIVLDRDPLTSGLQASWDTQLQPWRWLFATLEHHPLLKSGVSFGDGGHIERRNWEQVKHWADRAS